VDGGFYISLRFICICIFRFSNSPAELNRSVENKFKMFNLLKPNDIYIYMSYRSANLQTLHFKYVFNKYTYWIF